MIKGIHHVAVAVRSLDEALPLYEELFNIKAHKIEPIPEQGVKAAILALPDGTEIELLEPIDPQGGVAKFIESRGEGLHHVCFKVDDVDRELNNLKEKGVRLIDHYGRQGLSGKIGFIHPKSVKEVLTELVQIAHETDSGVP